MEAKKDLEFVKDKTTGWTMAVKPVGMDLEEYRKRIGRESPFDPEVIEFYRKRDAEAKSGE